METLFQHAGKHPFRYPTGLQTTCQCPARLVTLRFDHPRELVTVILVDDGADGVNFSYEFVSLPAPKDEAASRRGVQDMLDHIEDGIRRGTIKPRTATHRPPNPDRRTTPTRACAWTSPDSPNAWHVLPGAPSHAPSSTARSGPMPSLGTTWTTTWSASTPAST